MADIPQQTPAQTNDNGARKGFMEPEDYFMAVAVLSAKQSKDPHTQKFSKTKLWNTKKVVGVGYNKMPNGCEDHMPWSRSKAREAADAAKAAGKDDAAVAEIYAAVKAATPPEAELDTKYPYVCHAELNAIMNKNSADLKGCSIYVTLFPCNECAKLIIQAGMKDVVFLSDEYHSRVETEASRRMLFKADIPCRKFEPKPAYSQLLLPLFLIVTCCIVWYLKA